ncbi:MAG: hypothetical protein H0X35_04345 [Pseudonocardiales bacterium]|nr:hypothetical protein [Pseudonocardiales bacterium]
MGRELDEEAERPPERLIAYQLGWTERDRAPEHEGRDPRGDAVAAAQEQRRARDVEQAREAARIIVARQAEQERAAAPAPESLAERITRQLAEQEAQRAAQEREQQRQMQPPAPARQAERD